jgi:hypothetical protein
MSDEDDILAIVAALEFLESRDDAPAPKSRWKESGRDWSARTDWCHGERAPQGAPVEPRPSLSRPERKRTWKNS